MGKPYMATWNGKDKDTDTLFSAELKNKKMFISWYCSMDCSTKYNNQG